MEVRARGSKYKQKRIARAFVLNKASSSTAFFPKNNCTFTSRHYKRMSNRYPVIKSSTALLFVQVYSIILRAASQITQLVMRSVAIRKNITGNETRD